MLKPRGCFSVAKESIDVSIPVFGSTLNAASVLVVRSEA